MLDDIARAVRRYRKNSGESIFVTNAGGPPAGRFKDFEPRDVGSW